MKILVLGSDGYIGYPLTFHLLQRGHEVAGVDNLSRRQRIMEIGYNSLTPIDSPKHREAMFKGEFPGLYAGQKNISLGRDNAVYLRNILRNFKPNAIVHLAEQPSAAWSMANVQQASVTQYENVIGTLHLLWAMKDECPEAHLVKLGTMGEYGTPNCDIPEGLIPPGCLDNSYEGIPPDCPMQGLLFPRTAGSFYHLSKVMDTLNIEFACRTWNLTSTDIMQGVVFGLSDECTTRFDYDECFGTIINRFCVQVLANYPLTIYGSGDQIRGFLTLQDSIKCLTIALENPPYVGKYRTLNQFQATYRLIDLAGAVCDAAESLGFKRPIIDWLENPRTEANHHYYNPAHQKLFDLGYVPDKDIQGNITKLIKHLHRYIDRINTNKFAPKINWR